MGIQRVWMEWEVCCGGVGSGRGTGVWNEELKAGDHEARGNLLFGYPPHLRVFGLSPVPGFMGTPRS